MRVIHLVPTYLPVIGGAEINVHYLSCYSSLAGINVEIITYNMLERWKPLKSFLISRDGPIKIYKLPGIRPYPNIKYLRAILPFMFGIHVLPLSNKMHKIIKSADLIHFHDEVDLSFCALNLRTHIPKIFHIRTLGSITNKQGWFPPRKWILCNGADLFICNSKRTAEILASFGVTYSKIHIIPNGVDTNIFFPDKKIARVPRRLLFVGRLNPEKKLDLLIEALEYIKEPVELYIATRTPYNKRYYKDIISMIRNLSAHSEHQFTWLYNLKHEELSNIYRSAKILVSTSMEPFGNVNIEAMACGTPVVGFRAGGLLDIVDDGLNGLMVRPEDKVGLAHAIDKILNDDKFWNFLSENAIRKALVHYSWERIVKQIIEVYNIALKLKK